jgi:hypothetical protein
MNAQKPLHHEPFCLPAVVLLLSPVLCGCLVIFLTWWNAANDVRVWRREFQYALDQQCPLEQVNIIGGAGRLYLDAYQLDYQWTRGTLKCSSNGRIVRCNCATPPVETDTLKYLNSQAEE